MSDTTKKTQELSLWEIIKPVNRHIYAAMTISAISAVTWIVALVLIRPVVSELMAQAPNITRLWQFLGISIGLILVGVVLSVYSFNWSHKGAFKLEEILRTQLTAHLAKVPLGYVITTGSGALKKILMDDVRSLHAFVADSTPLLARGYTTPLAALVLMFVVDWRMALISLAVFPIGMIGMQIAFKDFAEGRAQYDAANERINRTIIEYVQGMQVVRTFDDGTSSFKRYRDALEHATESQRAWSEKSQTGAFIARTLFAALPTLAIVTPIGIWMVQRGWLDVPTLLLFIFLAPTVAESVVPLVWLSQLIQMSKAGAKRIGRLLAESILPEPETSVRSRNGSVAFENVTFTYADREAPALQDVSLYMAAGTVTALVGPSGAGKSTIAQLIPRFWDVDAGAVKVGDIDVRHMSSDDLMQQVSFVFQNPFLLHDTIRENIRLGKPDATDAEIEAAARAAQSHDFILNELPDGYETKAGDRGTRLSGGQRQRITIARAILQNCPIVVLDEATAFADPENEAKIHAAIANLTAGKTLIVVAHRLSTIRDAHQIVVLDKGKVAEVGTHDELVATNGVYRGLWLKFEEAQSWGLRRTGEASDAVGATVPGYEQAEG